MTPRSATAWLVRIGFWVGVVLTIADPTRATLEYLTAPTVLLSLRDAQRVTGAGGAIDQAVAALGGQPRVAIHASLPARIEWPLRLRPGRHRIDTAVALDPQALGRPAAVTFHVLIAERDGSRSIASATIDPARRTEDQPWRPVASEFDTSADTTLITLIAETAAGPVAPIGGVYWEAPRVASLTDPPRLPLVLLGLTLAVACALAARRRAVSLGFAANPVVWVAYTACVAALLTEGSLRLAGWRPFPPPVSLAVAGAESAAWMDATVEDPELGYRYRPGLSITWPWRVEGEPVTDIDFATDADGFRNPPGLASPRVVVLGDSFIEGDLVDEPRTVRARLAGETGAQVRNLGLSGYGPQQYAIAARRFGLPARPEVVVVALFEGNDLGDAEFFDGWRRSTASWNDYVLAALRARRASVVVRPNMRLRTVDALVVIGSGLGRLLVPPPEVAQPANPFEARCATDSPAPDCQRFAAEFLYRETRSAGEWSGSGGWDLTRSALREVRDACRAAGASLFVVLIPTKESLYVPLVASSISPAAFDRFVRDETGVTGPHFDRFLANHGALDQVIEPFLREEAIDFLNLRPVFARAAGEGRRLHYRHDMHWNAQGHQEAAHAIAAGLRSLGWSKNGVDERRDRASLRQHDEQAEEQEEEQDRRQPPLLPDLQEVPQHRDVRHQ